MQTRLNVGLALVAGLVGGMLTRFVEPPAVSAQNQPQVVQEVRARSFVIVDPENRAVGTFTAEVLPGSRITIRPNEPPIVPLTSERIILRDAQGREIWSAGPGAKIMPLQASR
jgi:hypothetical protein